MSSKFFQYCRSDPAIISISAMLTYDYNNHNPIPRPSPQLNQPKTDMFQYWKQSPPPSRYESIPRHIKGLPYISLKRTV